MYTCIQPFGITTKTITHTLCKNRHAHRRRLYRLFYKRWTIICNCSYNLTFRDRIFILSCRLLVLQHDCMNESHWFAFFFLSFYFVEVFFPQKMNELSWFLGIIFFNLNNLHIIIVSKAAFLHEMTEIRYQNISFVL